MLPDPQGDSLHCFLSYLYLLSSYRELTKHYYLSLGLDCVFEIVSQINYSTLVLVTFIVM